ncbi:MAG: efflux RND transporter periplasmic adaptor subunit [Colwellia sp.]|nr:efflux RND transporter periplasmic adaptor subunit [Colwellia sp.]
MSTNILGKQIKPILVGMIIGSVFTFFAYNLLAPTSSEAVASAATEEKKPLYWVAPMDANYKKDKAGKSPMGMDLVPVYDDGGSGPDEGPGTIRISPNVINNLGVRTEVAQYKKLHSQINTVGFVTYDEDKLVHIHPRVQGWIEKLYINAVGDSVTKNQPLYDIYSPELVNAQEELLLALTSNNQRLLVAAQNRLTALKFTRASINKLKKDKKVQQFITFYAPQRGVVKQLDIREGFYVKPETMMLSIADLSQVWVKADVFEREVSQVSMGNKVFMRLDYLPNKLWEGSIEHIHPMIDPKTRTAIVRLRFDNKNGELKPNMFAQISIDTSSDERALLIPKEALIRTGNQDRVVLALGEGNFKSVEVSVGRYDNESVEILKGLSEGERVVSSAQFLLDSESSKSSDFKRMNYDEYDSEEAIEMEMNMSDNNSTISSTKVSSATVNGTVVSVMVDHRMVTIDREAIVAWGREADTVDFIVADNIDMSLFSKNAYVMFTFEVQESNFTIVSAMAMSKTDSTLPIQQAANDEGE